MGAAVPEFLAGNHCFGLSLWTAKLCSLQIGGMRFGLGLDGEELTWHHPGKTVLYNFRELLLMIQSRATIQMGYTAGFHSMCNLLITARASVLTDTYTGDFSAKTTDSCTWQVFSQT
jgi:hypothetical protein